MSELTARDVIAQVLRSAGILLPNDYTPAWSYDRKLNELAAEIDMALGGLTRQTLLLNQYAAANGAPEQRQYRWASDWADS